MRAKNIASSLIYLALFVLFLAVYGQDNTSKLYPVVKNGKWGYIDKTGQIVIRPQFDLALEFHGEFAQIGLNKKYGFIDRTGKITVKPQFDIATPFSQGLAGVSV